MDTQSLKTNFTSTKIVSSCLLSSMTLTQRRVLLPLPGPGDAALAEERRERRIPPPVLECA